MFCITFQVLAEIWRMRGRPSLAAGNPRIMIGEIFFTFKCRLYTLLHCVFQHLLSWMTIKTVSWLVSMQEERHKVSHTLSYSGEGEGGCTCSWFNFNDREDRVEHWVEETVKLTDSSRFLNVHDFPLKLWITYEHWYIKQCVLS